MSHRDLAAKYATQLAEARQQIRELEEAAADAEAEKEKAKQDGAPQCDNSRAEVAALKNELEQKDEQITNLSAELDTAQQKTDEYQGHIASLKSKTDELQTDLDAQAERAQHLEDELEAARVAFTQQQDLTTTLEGNVSDLTAKLEASAAREGERVQHLRGELEAERDVTAEQQRWITTLESNVSDLEAKLEASRTAETERVQRLGDELKIERDSSAQQQGLITTLEGNVSELKAKLEAAAARETELNAKTDASANDYRARVASLERKLEQERSEYQEKSNRVSELGRELTRANMEVEGLKRKNAALEKDASSMEGILGRREKRVRELHQELEQLRFNMSNRDKADIQRLQAQLVEAREETKTRTKQLEEKEDEVESLRWDLGEKEKEKMEAERRLPALLLQSHQEHEEEASMRTGEELASRDARILELESTLTEQRDEMEKQQEGIQILQAKVAKLEQEANDREARENVLISEVEARGHDVAAKQAQIDELKGLLEAERKRNASMFWQTASLKAQLRALEEKLREADKKVKESQQDLESLEAESKKKDRKILEQGQRLTQLRPERHVADEDRIRVLESEVAEIRKESQDRLKDLFEMEEALKNCRERLWRAEANDGRARKKRC